VRELRPRCGAVPDPAPHRARQGDHAGRTRGQDRRGGVMSAPVGDHDAVPPVLSPGRFAGLSVVVTGAVQGIGRAVADRVVREGGLVTAVDRAEVIAAVADELTAVSPDGDRVTPVVADLETFEGAQAAADTALATHGRIDVLINNVGGTIWARPY